MDCAMSPIPGPSRTRAPDRLPGYGGLRPPWGQSLLRSCLAAHSFPPPPPAYVLPAVGTPLILRRLTPKRLDSASTTTPPLGTARGTDRFGTCGQTAVRNAGDPQRAKPHQGGWGREGVRS